MFPVSALSPARPQPLTLVTRDNQTRPARRHKTQQGGYCTLQSAFGHWLSVFLSALLLNALADQRGAQ